MIKDRFIFYDIWNLFTIIWWFIFLRFCIHKFWLLYFINNLLTDRIWNQNDNFFRVFQKCDNLAKMVNKLFIGDLLTSYLKFNNLFCRDSGQNVNSLSFFFLLKLLYLWLWKPCTIFFTSAAKRRNPADIYLR